MNEPLYHLVGAAEYRACVVDDMYSPASLATEGFVHLSTADQLPATAARFHADTDELLLIVIDETALPDVRFEDLYGHGSFPHHYGAIPLGAMTSLDSYPPTP